MVDFIKVSTIEHLKESQLLHYFVNELAASDELPAAIMCIREKPWKSCAKQES